jgi:hypothetical protein
MTTDCLTDRAYLSGEQKLHDVVIGFAVAVIFIIPATLAVFTVL